MDKTKGLLVIVFEITLAIIGIGALFLFIVIAFAPHDATSSTTVKESGRVNRLHDSISNKRLMNIIEKNWEELGLDVRLDEMEQKIDKGDIDYQPRRTRRVENKGEEFRVERKFKKSGDNHYIEGTLYFITRQSYKVGIYTRYKDHEIEMAKIKFDVDVDKNEQGWKSSNIVLSKKQ